MERGSGILLHISSLPSKHGIGTFGREAHSFVRFLVDAKQKYWQMLPLNPTGFGDSPYQSFSAFALNPYFVDLDALVNQGLLTTEQVKGLRGNMERVNYGKLYNERFPILHLAYRQGYSLVEDKVLKFYKHNKKWLEDYALFMVIKGLNNGASWLDWDLPYRYHQNKYLDEIKLKYKDEYQFWIFVQYLAFEQYMKLKRYAKSKGIMIIGDMPIYVSLDSADVWGNHTMFQLNSTRRPTKVAGVPPDYFSVTGQLWGNPLYDYEKMKKTGYRWWKQRVKHMSKLYDLLRIDHFRGFESYWAVPAKDKTAENGEWIKGPGIDLFNAIKPCIGNLQIIAEDLGIITPEVKALKAETKFPGLKVYQFAFGDYEKNLAGIYEDETTMPSIEKMKNFDSLSKEEKLVNPYLPHNYETNCVAYIGTHDNDVMEHYLKVNEQEIKPMLDYLKIDNPIDIQDTLIGSLMRSAADVVIFTPQDLLHLDETTRMNTPGSSQGNWTFRLLKEFLNPEFASHLKAMVEESHR